MGMFNHPTTLDWDPQKQALKSPVSESDFELAALVSSNFFNLTRFYFQVIINLKKW